MTMQTKKSDTYKLPPTVAIALNADRPEMIDGLLKGVKGTEIPREIANLDPVEALRLIRDLIEDRFKARSELAEIVRRLGDAEKNLRGLAGKLEETAELIRAEHKL